MTVVTHSVTWVGDIEPSCPCDTSSISSTSTPSTGDVDRWIVAGASRINTILQDKGVDPSTLGTVSADAQNVVKDLIVAYVTMRVLEAMGDHGATRDTFRDMWRDGIRALERRSFSMLGSAQHASSVLKTNISTPSTRRRIRDRDW